jgi:hypothetical protein
MYLLLLITGWCRYVDSPYLVGGKKFDLRIYALVTCYSPLRVFLYRWVGGRKGRSVIPVQQ